MKTGLEEGNQIGYEKEAEVSSCLNWLLIGQNQHLLFYKNAYEMKTGIFGMKTIKKKLR